MQFLFFLLFFSSLDYTLSHHSMCYFHKSCNVGTFYVIDISVRFSSVFYTLFTVGRPRAAIAQAPEMWYDGNIPIPEEREEFP